MWHRQHGGRPSSLFCSTGNTKENRHPHWSLQRIVIKLSAGLLLRQCSLFLVLLCMSIMSQFHIDEADVCRHAARWDDCCLYNASARVAGCSKKGRCCGCPCTKRGCKGVGCCRFLFARTAPVICRIVWWSIAMQLWGIWLFIGFVLFWRFSLLWCRWLWLGWSLRRMLGLAYKMGK